MNSLRVAINAAATYAQSVKRRLAPDGENTRAQRFVGISFRGPVHDRRAWTSWAGLDVWEIVEAHEDLGYEGTLEETDIPREALDLALAYYEAYPEEVDRFLEENRRSAKEWHALYPTSVPAPRGS